MTRTARNVNYEGIPSTLLGIRFTNTLGTFIWRLPLILWRTFIRPPRPDYFVLEVGTTKHGDIATSLRMFRPTITIITTFIPSHLEGLGSIEGIAQEKSQLISALPKSGCAVLRYDDERVRTLSLKHPGKSITYGFNEDADTWMEKPVRLDNGFKAVLHDKHGQTALQLPNLSNEHHLYAVMAAWSVGRLLGIKDNTMKKVIKDFSTRAGRGQIINGLKNTVIMDEAWNANPSSMESAFSTFNAIASNRRRVVILGDMLELGPQSVYYHRQMGRAASEFADVLIGVGERAKYYVEEFRKQKPDASTKYFPTVEESFDQTKVILKKNDAVLIKGSHGIHLDVLVDELRL